MRALREANVNVGIDVISQSDYDALASKASTTLYIVGTVASGNVTISNVYVGLIAQDILIDNNGAIAWVRSNITGHTNAAVSLANLV